MKKIKFVNGEKAFRLIKKYVDEQYSGEDFKKMGKSMKELSFDVEFALSSNGKIFHDYRIYDPYQNYCSGRYINPSGWTHWQMESQEVKEFEANN